MQAASPQQAGGTPGISSTVPVPILSRRIVDKPQASDSDTNAPPAPLVPSADHGNAFGSGSDASFTAGGVGGSPMPSHRGPSASALLEYIRHLNRLSANEPQASIVSSDEPGASLAPSDSPAPMGLRGRLAALAGIDPDNPDQLAPPVGGLLARLLAVRR
jgi:hypothetical protein